MKQVKIISISNAHQWDGKEMGICALLDIMSALQNTGFSHTVKWIYIDKPDQVNICFI